MDVGSHGDHDYFYHSGTPVVDSGKSEYVFESGTGLGSAVPARAHRWTFDGVWTDTGENAVAGNTLDERPGGVTFTSGVDGQAAQFDGQDGTGAFTDSHNLGYTEHTIAAWVNFDSLPASAQIVEWSASDGDEVRFEIDNAYGSDFAYVFRVGSQPDGTGGVENWNEYVTRVSPSTGGPTLFVGTYDGSDMNLYVDGSLADGSPTHYDDNDNVIGTGSFSVTPEWGSLLGVGNDATQYFDSGNAGQPLPGYVDDLSVWTEALSASQVQALYDSYQ